MSGTEYINYQRMLLGELRNITVSGKAVSGRTGWNMELIQRQFKIINPLQRFTFIPDRKNNPIATMAETLWVLAGRNDVAWLAQFLPRAFDFSDDGTSWRAGYGPRLRKWFGRAGMTDQVHQVIEELRENPESRRAVITIWDPSLDWIDSKDIPCNNWIQFLARDGYLHMNVAIRSQDIIWGSMINMFLWSVLQELVAGVLGYYVGTVSYQVGSLHLYERHYDRAHVMVKSARKYENFYDDYQPVFLRVVTDLKQFDSDLRVAFMVLDTQTPVDYNVNSVLEGIANPLIHDFTSAILSEIMRKQQADPLHTKAMRLRIGAPDIFAAVKNYQDRWEGDSSEA